MAQRVQVDLIDDLTGEQAQETVRFGIEDNSYDIDLTTENAEKLRSTLSQYVDSGRKARTGRRAQSARATSTSGSKQQGSQKIRQWAQDNGYNPSSRGRITQSIVDAYNEATK